jgi:beta-phosphoglucomutase-like phosphatase (HAD superfamily)
VYELKPKPCGDIIHAACARLGLRAERCLFVGDSKYDLMSSTTAGCFAVGIGEKGRGGHFHVDTVAQLATKLEEATKAARVGSL